MTTEELKEKIKCGALSEYSEMYADCDAASRRFIRAIERFEELYGKDREAIIVTAPGRSEIIGNHTDHNGGAVLAAAINRDIIAIAAKSGSGTARITSEGYNEIVVDIALAKSPESFEKYTSSSLIAGVIRAGLDRGVEVSGFDVYMTTEVLKGSGLSSSAAFEVAVGAVISHLFYGGKISAPELAIMAKYAENEYFGKPCGLMDQMASAVGGFVFIDFEKAAAPVVEPIDFSLTDVGYELCIINTGGNHADLTPDYAAVPAEMRSVAAAFGRELLRGISEKEIISKIKELRADLGDRAILRAIHYVNENERVFAAREALLDGDTERFFECLTASGNSSFKYLQNVYSPSNVGEQGLSLALSVIESFGEGVAAHRLHGGGFAGTVQAIVKSERAESFAKYMDAVFGDGATMRLSVRPRGAVRLF